MADVLDKAAEGSGAGVLKLETAKLPEPMRAMGGDERRSYVVNKKAEREEIMRQNAIGIGRARCLPPRP